MPLVRPSAASWPYWASLDEDAIKASLAGDVRAAQIRVLSQITASKMSGVRHAVHASLAALGLLATAVTALAALAIS